MNSMEKKCIYSFRFSGRSYREIAELLAIKENTVKSYCFRNHLTDKDIKAQAVDKLGCCQQCGSSIEQQLKCKPRRFCSDKCRVQWWNDHRQLKRHKNPHLVKCIGCGTDFIVYGSQSRKYCSHECYIHSRYGGGKA